MQLEFLKWEQPLIFNDFSKRVYPCAQNFDFKKNSILVQPQYYSVKNKEPNTNIFSNIQYTYMICKKRPKKQKTNKHTYIFDNNSKMEKIHYYVL